MPPLIGHLMYTDGLFYLQETAQLSLAMHIADLGWDLVY